MTEEKLRRCNVLQQEIYETMDQIDLVLCTQEEAMVPTPIVFELSFYGRKIVAPKSLYKIIGKLILDEYKQKLIELETEFNNL